MSSQWLAEIQYYDKISAGVKTLYCHSGNGFMTQPSDTPSSQFYRPVISQPPTINRALFTDAQTQGSSRVGFGELLLLNGDAGLDFLLIDDDGIDGRQVRILRTELVGPPTYADFSEVWKGTMEQPEYQSDLLHIKLRDNQFDIDQPLQPTKYTGAGLGTLEGGASLKDQPKPLLFGVGLNTTPRLVEPVKQIYQISDSLINSIDHVYDNGVTLRATQKMAFQGGFDTFLLAQSPQALVSHVSGTDNIKWTTDGITWNTVATGLGTPFGISALYYCPFRNLFFIGGSNGKIGTGTPDGLTWTVRTTPFAAGDFVRAFSSSVGRVIAVGNAGSGTSPILGSSANGTTGWANRTSPFVNSTISREASYGIDMFIAIGDGAGAGTFEFAFSLDGDTWTRFTVVGPSGSICQGSGIQYLKGLWIASGYDGEVATSSNGQDWSIRVIAPPGTRSRVRVANNIFYLILLGGIGSGGYFFSDDGSNWKARNFGAGIQGITDLVQFGYDIILTGVDATHVNGATFKTSAPASYGSSSDLLDDSQAPVPGSYNVFMDAAGSYIRLGIAPVGTLTVDATEGATAADRTAAQIYKRLLARRSYVPASGDITATDAANSSVIGLYFDSDIIVSDACDQAAGAIGAAWFIDKTATFRIQIFAAPSGSPVRSFAETEILKPLARLSTTDPGRGVPVFRQILQYGQNYTVQASGLAASVPPDRVTFLAQQWQSVKDTDASVQTAHLLAQEVSEMSAIIGQSDAQTECTRRLTLRKVRRDRMLVVADLTNENLVVDLGTIVKLTHSRFGLTGGKLFVVLNVFVDGVNNQLLFNVWG